MAREGHGRTCARRPLVCAGVDGRGRIEGRGSNKSRGPSLLNSAVIMERLRAACVVPFPVQLHSNRRMRRRGCVPTRLAVFVSCLRLPPFPLNHPLSLSISYSLSLTHRGLLPLFSRLSRLRRLRPRVVPRLWCVRNGPPPPLDHGAAGGVDGGEVVAARGEGCAGLLEVREGLLGGEGGVELVVLACGGGEGGRGEGERSWVRSGEKEHVVDSRPETRCPPPTPHTTHRRGC